MVIAHGGGAVAPRKRRAVSTGKTYAHTYTLGTPSKYRAKYQTNSKLQAAQASGSVSIGKSPPDQSR